MAGGHNGTLNLGSGTPSTYTTNPDGTITLTSDNGSVTINNLGIENMPNTIATANQSNITLSSIPKSLDVFVNRARQITGVDFSTTGTTLTFTVPLDAGDIVEIRIFN